MLSVLDNPRFNSERTRYYGIRRGDLVTLNAFSSNNKNIYEVVAYMPGNNNCVGIALHNVENAKWFEYTPEHLNVVTKVEDRKDYHG